MLRDNILLLLQDRGMTRAITISKRIGLPYQDTLRELSAMQMESLVRYVCIPQQTATDYTKEGYTLTDKGLAEASKLSKRGVK